VASGQQRITTMINPDEQQRRKTFAGLFGKMFKPTNVRPIHLELPRADEMTLDELKALDKEEAAELDVFLRRNDEVYAELSKLNT